MSVSQEDLTLVKSKLLRLPVGKEELTSRKKSLCLTMKSFKFHFQAPTPLQQYLMCAGVRVCACVCVHLSTASSELLSEDFHLLLPDQELLVVAFP